MSGAAWLAARELGARKGRALAAVAAVAATAALVSGVEALSRLREAAVAADLGAVGAPIVLRPQGSAGRLEPAAEAAVARALGGDLRRTERRLVLPREGARPLVHGVEADGPDGPAPGEATAGAALAGRLAAGDAAEIAARTFRIGAFRPSSASAEDFALHVRLEDLQAALGTTGASELRVYLAPGVDPETAMRRLEGAGVGARVIGVDRGEVADRDLQASLSAHRRALYLFLAAVAGLALLVASHLDAAERRAELATLVALGASPATLLGAIVARSVLVSAAGSALGLLVGAGLALALGDGAGAAASVVAPLAAVPVAAIAIGAAAAIPSAIASARRNPVPELQEGIG